MPENFEYSTGSALTDTQVARLLIFQGIDPSTIRCWIDLCLVEHFKAGDLLMSPKAVNNNMFVVLHGRVAVYLQDGDEMPITHVQAGESVGEMSVLDGQFPSAYVRAEYNTHVLVLPRDTLLDMVDQSHGFARNLLYVFSSRIRIGNEAIHDSQRLQKEYEQHANIDVLTGLYNRRWINSFFQRTLNRSGQTGTYPNLSVMLIDADHFKEFNDTHGHFAGDHALKCIAESLKEYIRPCDIAARYGGEEFMIILPDTTWEQAEVIAERVRSGVAKKAIEFNGQSYPPVSISSGITEVLADDELGDVISAADDALYAAKAGGRNRVCISQR